MAHSGSTISPQNKRQNGPDAHEGSTIEEQTEETSVNEATRLSARLIYEVIRRDGEEELARPKRSLIWSGLAAGILISLSVLGEAVLRSQLPDTGTRYLVENLGYCLGFLVVILGRMQLFTENTITTVLPVVSRRTLSCLISMLSLWMIVLAANVGGAFAAAAFFAHSGTFSTNMIDTITELSQHAVGMGAGLSFVRGIPAGVLVASIVWMMPSARGNAFFIIVAFTWLIAAGDFTHVIAGSVEMAFLLLTSQLSIQAAIFDFFLPVLAGNVIGGTVIFTLLAWGQVKNEVLSQEGT